jgi:hypothetical protein
LLLPSSAWRQLYTASQARRPRLEPSWRWKPQILQLAYFSNSCIDDVCKPAAVTRDNPPAYGNKGSLSTAQWPYDQLTSSLAESRISVFSTARDWLILARRLFSIRGLFACNQTGTGSALHTDYITLTKTEPTLPSAIHPTHRQSVSSLISLFLTTLFSDNGHVFSKRLHITAN